mmetsp:Transcript_3767/g.11837  ORF Transcript_3767/g.11837 Transcript_3767/m.11837 type:complete len:278 (-) Transcript_3767:383-1216(-)
MQAEEGAEGTPLEPPHNELAEVWIGRVPVSKAANIRCPIRRARHHHVQPGPELLVEIVPRRLSVARPHRGAVPLRSGPRRPRQHHVVLCVHFSWRPFAVIDHPVHHGGVRGSDKGCRPRSIVVQPVVCERTVVGPPTGLVAVEPPVMQTVLLNIARLHVAPGVVPGLLREEIIHVAPGVPESRVAISIGRQQPASLGGRILGRRFGDRVRVRAHHQLDPKRFEFVHHPLGVGPARLGQRLVAKRVGRLPPVGVVPRVEVDDDERQVHPAVEVPVHHV